MLYKKTGLLFFFGLCVSTFLINGMEGDLNDAIDKKDYKLIKDILQQSPHLALNTDHIGLLPFQRAFRTGDYTLIELLLEPFKRSKSIQSNNWGSQGHPVFYAIRSRNPRILELVLNTGAYIDIIEPTTGNQPLTLALAQTLNSADDNDRAKMCAILLLLLKCIRNVSNLHTTRSIHSMPNIKKNQYLAHAAANPGSDDPTLMQFLLEYDLDLNAEDERGNTPLHIAVAHRHSTIALALLNTGRVNVNAINHRGITPLMMAAANEDTQLIEELFARGAQEAHDERGFTTLEHASTPQTAIRLALLLRPVPRPMIVEQDSEEIENEQQSRREERASQRLMQLPSINSLMVLTHEQNSTTQHTYTAQENELMEDAEPGALVIDEDEVTETDEETDEEDLLVEQDQQSMESFEPVPAPTHQQSDYLASGVNRGTPHTIHLLQPLALPRDPFTMQW